MTRFTVDGSDILELRIWKDLETIRERVRSAVGPENLTALILGGGYGRGEGGVYVVDGEERTYNDYDFFVVVPFTSRLKRRAMARKLSSVGHELEQEIGIAVDFGPPMPLSLLPSYPNELMYLEAKKGHVVVHGPSEVFDKLPDYDEKDVPLEEGARLLMNRGVGLWMARDVLASGGPHDPEEHEFVVRNCYKATQALGDVILMLRKVYCTSYAQRAGRLASLDLSAVPASDLLRIAYDEALAFKLRPRHNINKGAELEDWVGKTCDLYLQVFIWFEQQRLCLSALDLPAYALHPRRLAPGANRETAKNLIRNFCGGGFKLAGARGLTLHPRDNILRILPTLLQRCPNEEVAKAVTRLWARYG